MQDLKYLLSDDKSLRRVSELRNGTVWISVGYGVLQEQEVSARLVAYLLPAMYLAKQLMLQGNNVLVRIYFAQQSAPIVLGKAVSILGVEKWVGQAKSLSAKFIKTFYPDINFRLYSDAPWVGKLKKTIDRLSLGPWTAHIQKFVQDRYPNPSESFRYLSAHSLYMLDPLNIDHPPILTDEPEVPEGATVVVIGGPQEGFTYEVRDCVKTNIGQHDRWGNFTVRTPIGKLPVYYATASDVTMENFPQNSGEWLKVKENLSSDAWHDLEYLAGSCFGSFEDRKSEEVFLLGMEEFGNQML